MADPDGQLLAQAQVLEAEARRVGDASAEGRELLAQAAHRRVAALGARVYPVLVCADCFRVTGWTSAVGSCDACLRLAQLRAAYSDPRGGFVSLDDRRAERPSPKAGRRLGLPRGRDRARVDAWLARVDPDETGPISPEPGYEVEVAERDEVETVDGSGMIVRFRTAAHRFDGTGWVELDGTRIATGGVPFPAEQSAALPTEQLVEAWLDFKGAVRAFNAGVWSAESQRREAARLARNAHDEAVREQRSAVDLLDES